MTSHQPIFKFLSIIFFGFSFSVSAQPTEQSIQLIGEQFAEAVNTHNIEAINQLFDIEAIASQAASSVYENPNTQSEYKRGLLQGLSGFGQRIAQEMEIQQGVVRYLRNRDLYGTRGALVRYDLAEGYNYVLLKVTNENKISDMHIATNGQWLTDTLGGVAQLMIAPNKSLLGRLFDRVDVDTDTLDKMKEIGTLQRQGDLQGAYAVIREFPPEIRNQRIILNLALQYATQINENAYRQELSRMAQFYKDDPSAAFMLIDYYYYQQDYASAEKIIDNMEKAYGFDGVITLFRANVKFESGDYTEAINLAKQGISIEPFNEGLYWVLFNSSVLNNDFATGVSVLTLLEEKFDYYFEAENFAEEQIFNEFVESSEFNEWIANH